MSQKRTRLNSAHLVYVRSSRAPCRGKRHHLSEDWPLIREGAERASEHGVRNQGTRQIRNMNHRPEAECAARWSRLPVKYAVVVIDLLKGYVVEDSPKVRMKHPVFDRLRTRILEMIPDVRKLLQEARSHSIPVIFVMHTLMRVGNKYDDGGAYERHSMFYKQRYPVEVYLEGTKWVQVIDCLLYTSDAADE